jgi:diguanylate cyclase (GGDEF)-like protein/PAS domain S-box-containing protein
MKKDVAISGLEGKTDSLDVDSILQELRRIVGARASGTDLTSALNQVLSQGSADFKGSPEGDDSANDGEPLPIGFFVEALANSHAAAIGVEESGEIAYFNRAACRLFGFDCLDVVGRSAEILVPSDTREAYVQHMRSFRKSSETTKLLGHERDRPLYIQRHDSTLVPVEITLAKAGGLVVATVRDITTRTTLRTVIDNMPGGVSMFNANLEMIACNDKMRELLEFPDALFADGLPSLETLLRFNVGRGEYGEVNVEEFVAQGIERAKNTTHHVFERVRPNGRALEVRGSPLPGGGFVTIYTDITARKEAERKLQEAKEEIEQARAYLHSVIAHLPQGVTVINENLDIIVWNKAFTDVLEIPDSVMPFGAIVPYARAIGYVAQRGDYGPGDPNELVAQRVDVARRFEPHHFERIMPNGRIIEIDGKPMKTGGFVTTDTDITAHKAREKAMSDQALVLRTIIDTVDIGISLFDQNLILVASNEKAVDMLGFPRYMQKPGTNLADYIRFNAERGEYGAGDVETLVNSRIDVARQFQPHFFERRRPNGRILEIHGTPVPGGGGFVTTYTDVTDLRTAVEKLEFTLDLINEIIDNAGVMTWELDQEGHFTFLRGAEKVLGHANDKFMGQKLLDLAVSEDRASLAIRLTPSSGALSHFVTRFLHKSGQNIWLSLSGHPKNVSGGKNIGFQGIAIDITEKHLQDIKIQELLGKLAEAALHDPLTGLANRTKFGQRFEEESRRQRRSGGALSLLVVDLDHFKAVNDTYGHLVGDLVLKQVARVLNTHTRSTDLAARFGGEEFIILLPDTDLEGAISVAEHLRQGVASAGISLPEYESVIHITCSVGVSAMLADHPRSFDDLMEEADQAVYASKRYGRNRVCTKFGEVKTIPS